MSQNLGDDFSSDEVTVYKDEGEEGGQTVAENFGADKVDLIKEAESGPKGTEQVVSSKDAQFNAPERSTPAAHRQLNNVSTSLFDGNGALSPSTVGLFGASGPYAALLSSRIPNPLSPATLGLLAHQPAPTPPAGLSADQVATLLAAGVTSPPLAAAVAARASPALAAFAAALHPYSRSTATTPAASTTPGAGASSEFGAMVAAAGLQQLAAAVAAASPNPSGWGSSTSASAASNWLYGTSNPPPILGSAVGGGIGSPGLAPSPAAVLLARLSPALSTLAQHNPAASLLLNAAVSHSASPSSVASSVMSNTGYNAQASTPGMSDNASLAAEVVLLRAAMMQQQQQHQQQTQQFATMLDAVINNGNQNGSSQQQSTPTSNVPVTPRSKHVTIPTPTSRPRPQQPMADSNLTPMNLISGPGSLAGSKRSHHGLAHQTTRPDQMMQQPIQPQPMIPMVVSQPQQPVSYHQHQAHHHSSVQQSPSAFMDPRRQAHLLQQQQHAMNMAQHHHQQMQHRSRSPPSSNEPHIKKPLNAFMLFMKEQRAQVIAECTLKESAAINQILGQRWHNLSRDEQARYYDLAKAEKERHAQLYPNWSARENYASQAKRKRRRKMGSSNGGYPAGLPGGPLGHHGMVGGDGSLKDSRDSALKKCRARYGVDQMEKWCKPCRRKKKCARYYNLPGADDDNDIGDTKSTPSSHMNIAGGLMSGMGMPNMGHFGSGLSGHDDDDNWSESGSSVGDSEDDEDQLNAFHLVTESSSASSTPSPSPAVMAPLSPSSSIHSSASHHRPHQHQHYLNNQVFKLPPGTPTMSDPSKVTYPPMSTLILPPQQPGAVSMPQAASATSSASSELPSQPPLPSTPPSSTNTAQQLLCSPNSTNTGIAYRPLLPAN